MTTTAATARNIRLILETIITSHTGIAYHVEQRWRHAVWPRFQSIDQYWACVCRGVLSLSVLYSVICHSHCLWISRRDLCVSPKSQTLCNQVIWNYQFNFKIVHNNLCMAITSLIRHCKYIDKFVWLWKSLLLVRKCVQSPWFSPISPYLDVVRLETPIFG